MISKEKQYISWPSENEKRKISRRIRKQHGFPNCVGFVDGTLIVLSSRPELHGEEFYSHKGRYGISTTLVCDDNRRITKVISGYPGCVHDNVIYKESSLYEDPDKYFDGKEYLLADSAYACSKTVIPAFKALPGRQMSDTDAFFNEKLSSARVAIEHCNGLLKGITIWTPSK